MVARNRPAGIAEHRSPTLLKVTWKPPQKTGPGSHYPVTYDDFLEAKDELLGLRVGRGHGQRYLKQGKTSKYRGVYRRLTKAKDRHGVQKYKYIRWSAGIQIEGEERLIGTFRSEEDAAKAWDKLARLKYGEDAILSFPDEV